MNNEYYAQTAFTKAKIVYKGFIDFNKQFGFELQQDQKGYVFKKMFMRNIKSRMFETEQKAFDICWEIMKPEINKVLQD